MARRHHGEPIDHGRGLNMKRIAIVCALFVAGCSAEPATPRRRNTTSRRAKTAAPSTAANPCRLPNLRRESPIHTSTRPRTDHGVLHHEVFNGSRSGIQMSRLREAACFCTSSTRRATDPRARQRRRGARDCRRRWWRWGPLTKAAAGVDFLGSSKSRIRFKTMAEPGIT